MSARLSLALAAMLVAAPATAQAPSDWTRPFPAHRVIGNLYYVGTHDLASFLIATPEGHILVNTGLRDSLETIREGVEALGFRFEDIRVLLEMQAHFDHVAALAAIQKQTGAKVFATPGDAELLESGGAADYLLEPGEPAGRMAFEAVEVDRVIRHGETVELGGTRLEVIEMPGHTQGSVGFAMNVEEDGRTYRALLANMGTVNNIDKVRDNPRYPRAVQDYRLTFERQRKLSPDAWVAAHASQYGLHEKFKPGDEYRPERFVDPTGYRAAVERHAARFEELLAGRPTSAAGR